MSKPSVVNALNQYVRPAANALAIAERRESPLYHTWQYHETIRQTNAAAKLFTAAKVLQKFDLAKKIGIIFN